MSWSVPHIGVLTAMGGVILGQMLGALVLDNIGAFGLPIHPVSPARIAAVLMIGGGLFLSRL
jgi:transporter family-2 protein